MQIWLYTLTSVFIVSLLSLLGLVVFPFPEEKIKSFLIWAVAFAAGTLLGDAFLHLIPEAYDSGTKIGTSLSILGGIAIFFILEKFIHWHHCHDIECEDRPHVFSYVIMIGDGVHNFIDGMIIAGSYLVSIPLGVATTMAVIFHEVPHEIGDFAAMLYGGFDKKKALLFNLIAGILAIFGAVFVLLLSNIFSGMETYLVPFAAGGFIYIAIADIIPELHKTYKTLQSTLQFVFMGTGVWIMYMLLILG